MEMVADATVDGATSGGRGAEWSGVQGGTRVGCRWVRCRCEAAGEHAPEPHTGAPRQWRHSG